MTEEVIKTLVKGFLRGITQETRRGMTGTGKIYRCRYDVKDSKCTKEGCYGRMATIYRFIKSGTEVEWVECTGGNCRRRERRWYYFHVQEGVNFRTFEDPPFSDSFFEGHTVDRAMRPEAIVQLIKREVEGIPDEEKKTVQVITTPSLPVVNGEKIILVQKGWGLTESKKWVQLPPDVAEEVKKNGGDCRALVPVKNPNTGIQVFPGHALPPLPPSNSGDVGYFGGSTHGGWEHTSTPYTPYMRCNEHGFPIPDAPKMRLKMPRHEVGLYGKEGKIAL